MAEAFRRERKGRISCHIEPSERALITQLLGELCALLTTDDLPETADLDPLMRELGLADLACAQVSDPDDPVLRRLLPSGYPGDPEAAAEFRRYTDTSLRTGKIDDARTMKATLDALGDDGSGFVAIDKTEATAWLRAINDLRLALGVQLNVTAESYPDPTELADDDQAAFSAALYDFLTWWQDSLVRALLPR